jgi:protein-tyrosine phosphatase
MDRGHLALLQRSCPPPHQSKLGLFLDFAKRFEVDEVPDPYYGDARGFEHVLDLVEDAATQMILKLAAVRPE